MAIVVIAYLRVVHAGFIWDDDRYVENNVNLRTLAGLGRIWLNPSSEPQYYPVTHSSFWIEYHLWGLNPLGYHIDNVLLHLASTLLLWIVLRRLKVAGAWMVAAIFAIHPVQVESVAWITERKNVLAGTFFFLSLHAWLVAFPIGTKDGARSSHARLIYVVALLLFVLALLAKSVTASMPAILLCLIWWKTDRIRLADLRHLMPFILLGLVMGRITAWMETHIVGASGPEFDFTPLQRCIIASRAIWFYACKLLWPARITFTYPKWNLDLGTRPWLILFPIAMIAVPFALWLLRMRTGRGPLVAVVLFAGILFPALGFVNVFPMRYSFVADHFQYLACIPLICLIVAGAEYALPRPARKPAALVVIAVLFMQTWRQVGIYRDRESLWRDTIAKNPTGFMAHSNLGDWLEAHGAPAAAEDEYLLSIQYYPDNFPALRALGHINSLRGHYAQSLSWDERALDAAFKTSAPDREPYFFIGAVYTEMADAEIHLGRLDAARIDHQKAIDNYRLEIETRPEDADAFSNLGQMMADDGHLDTAIGLYHRGLQADPDSVAAHTNLGNALLAGGDIEGATAEYKASLHLQPDNAKAHNNLGAIYARRHLWDASIAEFEAAITADPNFQLARDNLNRAVAAKAKSR